MGGVNGLSSNLAGSYTEALGDLERSNREKAKLAGSIAVSSAKQAAAFEQSAIERQRVTGWVSAGLAAARAVQGGVNAPKDYEARKAQKVADAEVAKHPEQAEKPQTPEQIAGVREKALLKGLEVTQQQVEQGIQVAVQEEKERAQERTAQAGVFLADERRAHADAREEAATARELGQELAG